MVSIIVLDFSLWEVSLLGTFVETLKSSGNYFVFVVIGYLLVAALQSKTKEIYQVTSYTEEFFGLTLILRARAKTFVLIGI